MTKEILDVRIIGIMFLHAFYLILTVLLVHGTGGAMVFLLVFTFSGEPIRACYEAMEAMLCGRCFLQSIVVAIIVNICLKGIHP